MPLARWILCLGLLPGLVAASACAEAGSIPDCVELRVDPETCAPLFAPEFARLYEEVLVGSEGEATCAQGGGACHARADAQGAGGGLIFAGSPDEVHARLLPFVEPGEPSCGAFSVRTQSEDPDYRMPPGQASLDEGTRCAIAIWVHDGALP